MRKTIWHECKLFKFLLCLIKKLQALLFKGDIIKARVYVPLLKNWSHIHGFLPHWALMTRNFLNDKLLIKWISELWPPLATQVTRPYPTRLLPLVILQSKSLRPPMPKDLREFRTKLKTVIEQITPLTSTGEFGKTWQGYWGSQSKVEKNFWACHVHVNTIKTSILNQGFEFHSFLKFESISSF